MNLVKKVRPEIHIQPIPRPSPSVSTFFPVKDLILKDLQSHIVYQLNCLDCEASYIGKTIRQIKRRLKEHGAPQPIKQSSLSHLSIDTPTSTQEVRRSARNTRKKVNYKEMNSPSNLDHEDIDLEVTTTNSALRKHELETKHTIDWLSLKILAKDNAKYRLLVRESLAILDKQPLLNRTVSSVPLVVFPDGVEKTKPTVKIK
ncbi:unnamed protein product [Didymodactylos carnosus]|uniref:GIY-YIG domain-containing protein n=1 Tax=Didymodactylos carnosus TaxID=1234261 RepID=A0A8S2G4E1_9BILA|nr:unnamed protein product [Didymodactylos carnosus]CAF4437021.1 unnamed protein product [Didymodactylos carnosus]